MARPPKIDQELVQQAQTIAATAKSAVALRQCQAVLLPALFGATLAQTAEILGVSRATVPRLQAAFRQLNRQGGPVAPRNWGGRRKSLLSPAEEAAFLQPWLASATAGNLVVAAPIRAALAQRLGRPVKHSVVYRMLARHGWRKVAPDTRHPKNDPGIMAGWKKNSRNC